MKTPGNPENAPFDKIPAGWRSIYEEEYDVKIPTRLWDMECQKDKSVIFSNRIEMTSCRTKDFTYITPDLPDNGQPWHAHKPGDPAPVASDVKVDIVCRSGEIFIGDFDPVWSATTKGKLDILFYRLHEPAIKTFEAHGHTWFRHTPGDPCPCDNYSLIHVLLEKEAEDALLPDEVGHAGEYYWGGRLGENHTIVGWRYADSPVAKSTFTSYPTSDRILSILIAAGYITEEQVEQARKLIKD